MARVDFYLLNQAGQHSRQTFACRLAEKAYRLNNTVHIHAGSRGDADRLDELLWTFRDGSFVPHERVSGSRQDAESPITIGCENEAVEPRNLRR
jgi:DNA polymerase-3 subunit chi